MSHIRNLVGRITLIVLGDRAPFRRQEGQTLVEYGLILGLLVVVLVVILTTLGTQVSSVFNTISNDL